MVRTAEEGRKWIELQPAPKDEDEEKNSPRSKRKAPELNPNVSPKRTRSQTRSTSPSKKESPKKESPKKESPKKKRGRKGKADSSASTSTSSSSSAPLEGQEPRAGARAFFTGALIGDTFIHGTFSEVYVVDSYSEYVGEGRYASNQTAFPKAIAASFDGIAIDAGTKVTVYSQPSFEGNVLYQKTGPAIVVNSKWKGNKAWEEKIFGHWKEPLNTVYPQSSREWSDTNMHEWNTGSLVVESGIEMPKEVLQFPEYALEHQHQLERTASSGTNTESSSSSSSAKTEETAQAAEGK